MSDYIELPLHVETLINGGPAHIHVRVYSEKVRRVQVAKIHVRSHMHTAVHTHMYNNLRRSRT